MGLASGSDVARRRTRPVEIALVVAILLSYAISRASTLDQPLLENHGFRQTQTAYGALVFHDDGVDWLRPVLPIFGRESAVPFEFPLFQAIASVPMAHGVEPDRAVRLTGLAFFMLTALLLWALLRRAGGRLVAIAGLVVFCFSPFGLLWGRTSMIEYLATAAGVGYLLAAVVYAERMRWPALAGGMLAGSIAFLVKPTTAVAYLIPAAAATFFMPLGARRRALGPRIALLAVPVVVGVAWTLHADAVKAGNPFAMHLTSSDLRTWTVGTLSQRFDLSVIKQISAPVARFIVGRTSLFLFGFALLAIWRSPRRRFWLAWIAGAVAGPILFTNLYYVHDYYLAAITPLLAGVVALGIRAACGFVTKHVGNQRAVAVTAVMATLLLVWFAEIHRGGQAYAALATQDIARDNPTLALADELRGASSADELAMVVGNDYDPSVLYYARRRGTAVPIPGSSWPGTIDDGLLRALASSHSLLVVTDASADTSVLRQAPWFAPVSAHVYRMANDRQSLLARTGLAVTTSTAEAAALPARPSKTTVIQCNGGTSVIQPGTTVRFEPVPQSGAHVIVGDGRAPVPVPVALIVDARSPGPASIGCDGATALVLHIEQ